MVITILRVDIVFLNGGHHLKAETSCELKLVFKRWPPLRELTQLFMVATIKKKETSCKLKCFVYGGLMRVEHVFLTMITIMRVGIGFFNGDHNWKKRHHAGRNWFLNGDIMRVVSWLKKGDQHSRNETSCELNLFFYGDHNSASWLFSMVITI